MIKKLSLLAMAVGALVAFAIPATASAEGILMDKDGTLQPGAKLTATSENLETTTVSGTLFCEEVTIHGEVETNNTEHATIVENEVTVSEECEITENGASVTITDPGVETITINADGTGSAEGATFVSDIPLVGLECHFEGNLDFTYETNTDVATLPEEAGPNLFGTGLNCPVNAEIHGSFTLETDDEEDTPVIIT